MCVVEVEGEEHPPISCSRTCEDGMKVQTQTEEIRRLRRTNLELIFSDHNAYCLPPCQNKCPSHIDIPGFLKQNAEGNFRESTRIFKRTIPFPSVLGRVCPAPCEEHCRRDEVDEAIAIRDSHRYAGDMVIKSMLDEDLDPPRARSSASRRPAGARRSSAPGRPAWPRPTTCCCPATTSPSSSATRRRAGCSATASRSTACRRSRSSRPSTRASPASAARSCATRASGRDFTLDDLQYQGFDAVVIAIGCYDTNKLGIPGEDAPEVLDGLEYLRTATLGLPYPGHKGKRVVVIGGGFTSMDCSRTSIRQGAKEVTLVYRRDMKDMPASNEVHEAIEEGVTAIFQAGPTRVITDKDNKVTGVEFIRMALGAPDASGRRRPEPAPGTEFTIPCDRVLLAIGQGPELDLDRARARRARRRRRTTRLQADAVTFETGRPGVFATGDVRIGAATVVQAIAEGRRAAYAVDAFLRGNDLAAIRTRQTLAEPQPEFLSIVPFTARGQGAALPAEGDGGRGAQPELRRVRDPVLARGDRRRVDALPPVHVRGDRLLRPAPPRHRVRHDARRRSSPTRTRARGCARSNENRFTGINHDYIRDDSHAFILREPSRCIDCGRCAQVCAEVVGAACYDFMRIGFDTLVTTPLDMSLNDTPCVSCGRCAETCPTGALMPKPRVLQKYEVDESRCILCGICVDACPYDALRDGGEFELAHSSREEPMIDLMAMAQVDRETEVTYIRKERDWLAAGDRRGPAHRSPTGCCTVLPPRRGGGNGNGHGHGDGHGHGARACDGESPARRPPEVAERCEPGCYLIAAAVAGAIITTPALIVLILMGGSFNDALVAGLATLMLGGGIAVVTMRDIIRCGLAMIVCFLRSPAST